MLKLTESGAHPVDTTTISNEDRLEENLRKWIVDEPAKVLGEDLRIIGREVTVNESGDAVDLLAINSYINIIVIELKKRIIERSVDFQALKYAAYTSEWGRSKLESQFENYKKQAKSEYDDSLSFGGFLDRFANEDYNINEDQRLIVVGESTGGRFKQVLEWLEQKGIDITLIEIQLYRDDNDLYLTTDRIVASDPRDASTGQTADQAWKRNGRKWHLDKANGETGELLKRVVTELDDLEKLNGPYWGQRNYISFGVGTDTRRNRVVIKTQVTLFHIRVNYVPVDSVDERSLATDIGVSSEHVELTQDNNGSSQVSITCHGGMDIDEQAVAARVSQLIEQEQH